MTDQTTIERRQGADQELAAVQVTTDTVYAMVWQLLEQQRQWDPELVQSFTGAFESGDASLRVVFDLDATGLVRLEVLGRQGDTEKQIFDIAPVRKLDS